MKKWQDKEEFKKLFTEKAHILWEKDLRDMTLNEVYQTIAYMIRDLVSEDWIRTNEIYAEQKVKQVYYFSIEFLIGRLLESNLLGIDMDDICRQGLEDLAGTWIGSSRPNAIRVWGMGDWGGWLPVSSTPWRRCSCRAMATASAISTACSTSASSTTSR